MEFRPSGSPPDQGEHYNSVLNDEELEKGGWYDEQVRGLTGLSELPRHTPKMIWSATSQVVNPAFAEMREKAVAGIDGFARFVFLIDDNPYVPDAEKAYFFEALPEDERPTRYYGIPAAAQRRVYGTYEPMGIHGCEPFELPPEWTRYAIVDPGTATCATLLVAIDPDERHLWVYGGIVLHNAEHRQWATALKKAENGVRFEAIIMDSRAGSQHNFNQSKSTAQQFAKAMRDAAVFPRVHGSMEGFIPSCSDVKARTMSLRNMMTIRPDGPFAGTPRLQIFKGCVPQLDKEIKAALSDKKDPEKRAKIDKQPCDVLDCLEYAANYNPHYHETEPADDDPSDAIIRLFNEENKKSFRRAQPVMLL
jgi:hypothetical protein